MTPGEHREKALELLERAQDFSPANPVRPTVLAEAQVHATLALVPGAPARRQAAPKKEPSS